MRPLTIPFAIWLGVLQLPPANQQSISVAATGTLIAAPAALAGLSVSIYRLGVCLVTRRGRAIARLMCSLRSIPRNPPI